MITPWLLKGTRHTIPRATCGGKHQCLPGQDAAVALVAAGVDAPLGDGRLDGAVRLVQVGAVREAAARDPPHFPEALDQFARRDGPQAEFCHAGAIYKEAVRHSVEAGSR